MTPTTVTCTCDSMSAACNRCGRGWRLGIEVRCPACGTHLDCAGCGNRIADDLTGVIGDDGEIIPWGDVGTAKEDR